MLLGGQGRETAAGGRQAAVAADQVKRNAPGRIERELGGRKDQRLVRLILWTAVEMRNVRRHLPGPALRDRRVDGEVILKRLELRRPGRGRHVVRPAFKSAGLEVIVDNLRRSHVACDGRRDDAHEPAEATLDTAHVILSLSLVASK